jgi:RNA polymerase sigma-70 factor (ECF subfamily)
MLANSAHTEAELLELFKAGDKAAFSTIYLTHAPALTGFVAGRLASLEEARDIIHDLFIYLWDEREHIHIDGSLKSYLFASARYRIIDHIRKNITRRDYAGMIQRLAENMVSDTEEEVVLKDLHQTLEHAVEDLPTRTRQIYHLSRYRHLAVKEIASKLGISEQTVKNQLSTALHHLRISWKKLTIIVLVFIAIA